MRNVEPHLLEDKMDEAVTHYINSHQGSEPVHIDTNGIPMTVQDVVAGRVTVTHQQTYTTQMCRQMSVTEQVGDGPWGEELLEGPIAAIVAQLQNSRHHPPPHHKVAQVRTDVDHSVILDGTMRYNGQALDQQNEPIVVQLPPMQTLPPLQDMKRCADTDWFSDKNKKDEPALLRDSDGQALELGAAASPAQHRQQSRKSLPHKKRISRKLKRNTGNCTPQQELVVINCSAAAPAEQEQILPDSYGAAPHAHHVSHEVRPMFICQICGDYYGEEQLKFYHHLKQHYEPHTIIIENPVSDLAMDKMTNNCIVDNVATLPDSIVELSLENTVPKTMYQPIDKHVLYTSSDKTLTYNSNKLQYSMASMDKEPPVPTVEAEKSDLYETLNKLELYNCGKCSKTFRKQKQCEAHMREAHSSNTKLEDMGEFSEPEDLMAGIQVCVGDGEPYEQALLPHLTVENGHVHQEHTRHWYGRGGGGGGGGGGGCAGGYCGVCAREPDAPPLKVLKEEVLQRIFDSEVSDNANFADSMMPDHDVGDHNQDPDHDHDHGHSHDHEQTHSQEHTEHDHSEHGRRHNELDHRHNDHDHRDNEHSRGHTQHGPGFSEHDHRHSEHDHRHNERFHGLENDHGHNEDCNEHSEPSHVHSDYGQSEHANSNRLNDHGHDHNDDVHDHNEHENSEHSQGHLLKQEVLRKDDMELCEAKGAQGPGGPRQAAAGRQYSCAACSRVFSHRNSLLYHALSHAGKQHSCRDCGKGFYTHGALKIHKRVHNGDRPYKCDVCGREFRQWTDLKYHKISLHTDKKHFKCEFCGKEFARKYSLNIHVRIHTGERNYKCDYCTKTFRASSYRLTHMRTHTGDRPYKCEVCEKCFRSAFDLRRHMLVHDKMRLRLDEHKPKAKDTQKKTKMVEPKEEKVEIPPKKIKQVALASTTKPPVQEKAKKPKKSPPKKGAPNVTVQNRDGHFKINDEYTNNVEVYDNRAEYTKFKNLYSDSDKFKTVYSENDKFKTVYSESDNPFKPQIVYKEDQPHRDLAVLRPMFRSPNLDNVGTEKVPYRTENTDGKMHVFTHVEKGKEYNGSIVSNGQVLGDIRHLEREVARDVRSEISGEGIETGFLERLTAIYNIPAV